MDYLQRAHLIRHSSWDSFRATLAVEGRRLILLTTRAEQRHDRFPFAPGDTIMVGRESAGVPPEVADAAFARIRIPMVSGPRSLNVALAAALVTGEALRQLNAFPPDGDRAEGTGDETS